MEAAPCHQLNSFIAGGCGSFAALRINDTSAQAGLLFTVGQSSCLLSGNPTASATIVSVGLAWLEVGKTELLATKDLARYALDTESTTHRYGSLAIRNERRCEPVQSDFGQCLVHGFESRRLPPRSGYQRGEI
jgi:hypothetical protein